MSSGNTLQSQDKPVIMLTNGQKAVRVPAQVFNIVQRVMSLSAGRRYEFLISRHPDSFDWSVREFGKIEK